MKRCYICWKEFSEEEMTRDHVPPKSLFNKPRPSNLITVPACRSCNNDQSDDDEYLRNFASMSARISPAGHEMRDKGAFGRSMSRPGARRRIDKLMMTAEPATYWDGDSFQKGYTIEGDEEILDRILKRITKGLLYHNHPTIDLSDLEMEKTILQKSQFSAVVDALPFRTGIFNLGRLEYDSIYTLEEDPRRGLWIHIFYGTVKFLVFHWQKGTPRPGLS